MNYYERHLGDYAKDTGHLSMLEHGAYTLLLDRYYAKEAGIPEDDAYRLARAKTKEERAAVDAILAEFFTLSGGVWRKGRIEEEIAIAQKRITAAQENGRRGGRPSKKANQKLTEPAGFSLGSENETQLKAHHTPSNHLPSSEAKASGGEPPASQESTSPEDEKRELYAAGKSLLELRGMPKAQCGSFITKLAKDHGQEIALEAVRSAVVNKPLEATEYLVATCLSLKGHRKPTAPPVTVPSDADKKTAAYLAEQAAHKSTAPPSTLVDIRTAILAKRFQA